ncbi:MAG: 1-(5-phosphoribosyl)-5-[(5-phosphoribosylamino)methylideneamino]imidazole-4-carboxamide isomerase [Pirellulales bacterium]
MQIWPAIDLRGGQCVRLQQGDYQRETVFGSDPVQVAQGWVDQGARCLHLVDLDGARDGRLVNLPVVRSIRQQVPVPCQLGGGVRDAASLEVLLEAGLDRVIIGTLAARDPVWFEQMAVRHPHRLVLGIDARDGFVATAGWLETASMDAVELARRLGQLPLAGLVYTDISKDGMLAGPNLAAMATMKRAVTVPVIASGGVTTLDDVRQLRDVGMDGCIVGRALYEGRLTLADALQIADGVT